MSQGWQLGMWFVIGMFSAFGYFIMAANDASFLYIWPLLVVIAVSLVRLWTWPAARSGGSG